MSYEQRHPTLAERDHVTLGAGNRMTAHIFCTASIVTCPFHRQMHEKCASTDGMREIKSDSRFGSCSEGKEICLRAEPVIYGSGRLTNS
jgi:predicted metal-binding transcription factor (methanogenesis marker protein 9)